MRLRRAFISAAVPLAIAACTGSEPAAPARATVGGPTADITPAPTRPACRDSTAIRRLIGAIVPAATVADPQQRFTIVYDLYCVRRDSVGGRAQMLDLVDLVVTRLVTGQLLPRPQNVGGPVPATTNAAATALVDRLFTFVGLTPELNLPSDALARAVWDGGAKVARPGKADTIISTSKDFATDWPSDFFKARALVVVARQPDAVPFQQAMPEYPPRYRVYVSPESALTNYGLAVLGPNAPTARVVVCPGDLETGVPHPSVATLRILRVRDPGDTVALPSGVLPLAPVALVKCTPWADAPPGGYGLFGTRRGDLLATFGRFGTAVAAALGPQSLYAWDSGVGGKSNLLSGFVPVRDTTFAVTGVGLLVDSAGRVPTYANPFVAPVGVPVRVTAVPYDGSRATPVRGVACTWSASNASGPVAIPFTRVEDNPNVVTFTPTQALSGGAYTIRATCEHVSDGRGMRVP
ncbi:hypothetical protein tb265_24650 [Gemmatimonadetes bacterium T265]|nr:hypothetical protein tb265_24650 [Gemmatimonadetes bacterium T265]